MLRRSLAFSLERAGFRVWTAASAEEGLAIAARERSDLVLLDLGLPGMNGLEALWCFHNVLGLPVVFLARMIVEAHGGRVDVESRRGEGACFTVALPLGDAHPPRAARG